MPVHDHLRDTVRTLLPDLTEDLVRLIVVPIADLFGRLAATRGGAA